MDAEVTRLRHEIFGLRAALRTRPLIARALGMLQGRYRLVDADKAFTLLKETAQRHNLKLSMLAAAFVAVAPPRSAHTVWFPGRIRRPAPPLTFQPGRQHNRTAVLGAFLELVMTTADTATGDLQLVDTSGSRLQLEQHHGLPPEFVDYFATVDGPDTPCGMALHRKERIVVPDVASDPVFAGTESRRMVLDAGVRAVQSTPLLTPDGRCVGTVSTHHTQAGHTPTAQQCAQIDRAATEVAVWLDWHQRTVVLDALEYLHNQASAVGGV